MLVNIGAVNRPRAIVPLLGYNPDISLNLFNILVISPVVDLKALNVNYNLNDINRYLPLVSNV
jgi:hypothetical protein